MKNAFLLTVLAAALLVGCNEPEEPVKPAVVTTEAPQKTDIEDSGLAQLLKVAECSAVSRIAEQTYMLAADGVSLDEISAVVFNDLTEADGPIYGLLQSTIKITTEEATKMVNDPTQIDAQLSTMSRLWSAEVFKLCASDQL